MSWESFAKQIIACGIIVIHPETIFATTEFVYIKDDN